MRTHTIPVDLGSRSYSIHVGKEMGSEFVETFRSLGLPGRVILLTDTHVAKHHLKSFAARLTADGMELTTIVIPPGERQKNLRRVDAVYSEMLKRGIGRRSTMIALGGGVIGDLAGFVAATFHRGIPVVQVPTTVIAQVDSAIGGKTGVNHPLGKNLIGAFHQPAFVWTDMAFLRTLPLREVASGLGEIVKYGVIADESLFEFLEMNLEKVLNLEGDAILHVQERCSAIKAAVVAQDEHEADVRMILNFGHTVGHALEAAGKFKLLTHGEAVLLGMVAEALIARKLGYLDRTTEERIEALIRRVPMRPTLETLNLKQILSAMTRDKKNVGNSVRFVLPKRIGEMIIVDGVHGKVVKESVQVGG